jgi:hypothetical protein
LIDLFCLSVVHSQKSGNYNWNTAFTHKRQPESLSNTGSKVRKSYSVCHSEGYASKLHKYDAFSVYLFAGESRYKITADII